MEKWDIEYLNEMIQTKNQMKVDASKQEFDKDGMICRDLDKSSSHCTWYSEKEDLESFWERKLRKLFKVNK